MLIDASEDCHMCDMLARCSLQPPLCRPSGSRLFLFCTCNTLSSVYQPACTTVIPPLISPCCTADFWQHARHCRFWRHWPRGGDSGSSVWHADYRRVAYRCELKCDTEVLKVKRHVAYKSSVMHKRKVNRSREECYTL